MFERPGLLYVYRSYGIHWCANVVCGPEGVGSAILLRAGKPLVGEQDMARRRGRENNLTSGPGNLCQALGIDGSLQWARPFRSSLSHSIASWRKPALVSAPLLELALPKRVEQPWRFIAEEVR